jgi:AcrR family transcriptional regulator
MKTKGVKNPLSPRKMAAQSRSVQTVQSVLQAAAHILANKSASEFNTNRIAEVAGISIGSLYQYFPSKNAILAQLIEQQQTALADQVVHTTLRLRKSTLSAGLRALIRIAIQYQHAQPSFAQAIDHAERHLEVSNILQSAQIRMCQAFAQWIKQYFPKVRSARLQAAAVDVFRIIKAFVDTPQLDRSVAARALAASVGYLQNYLR